MHVALRQVSNGAGAEAQQDIASVAGVALKIPAKPSLTQRHGHLIVGKREVIESDLHIAGFLQRICDRTGLLVAFKAVGQRRLVDPALVLLERRNVRVAKHRKTLGTTKFDASADRVETRRDGLVRQSVDQIEVDAGDADSPQAFVRGGGRIKALHPIDGALDDRIETLHAKARPIDAAIGKRLDHLRRELARVDLDGDLG